MITELRRYTIRPHCTPKMHARMRDVLLPLFEQHGIPRPSAVWETDEPGGVPLMTWMLEWPSLEARNDGWGHFRPIWETVKKARAEEEYVTRTDVTLIDPWPPRMAALPEVPGACESAWVVQPKVGFGAAFRAACESEFARLRSLGAIGISAWDFMFGPLPQSLVIASWRNRAAAADGIAALLEAAGNTLAPLLNDPGTFSPLTRADYLRAMP
jgi:hypothetical protein